MYRKFNRPKNSKSLRFIWIWIPIQIQIQNQKLFVLIVGRYQQSENQTCFLIFATQIATS